MRFKELSQLSRSELVGKARELRMELMKENAQVALGTIPKNPRKIRNMKKAIARIEFLLARKPVKEVMAKER